MGRKKREKKLLAVLLVPLGVFLVQMSSERTALVERYYSEGIYQPVGQFLSKASGVFPFSVAELLFILIPFAFVLYTIRVFAKCFCRRNISLTPFKNYIINIIVIISVAFFCFVALWGLNYYRLPFASIAGLEVRHASVSELESLCDALIERANNLRLSVSMNESGGMDIPGSSRDILKNCKKGYEIIARKYPELEGSYGDPKPVMLSKLMNYTGICGIYFPFTGEANVNISIPDSSLPSAASHEMAHQRGFAREDEANFISYLACSAHPDVNYKYSGVLLALTNSMNALYKADKSLHSKLAGKYSEGVRKDLEELNEFWSRYEGPVERTTEKINNTYLKANKQKDGVQSYGRMVDLLIAEHRQAGQQSSRNSNE